MEQDLSTAQPHPRRTAWLTRPLGLGLLVGLLAGVLLLWGLDSLGRMPRFGRPTHAEALRASRRNAIVQAVDRTRGTVVTIRVEGRRRITRPQDELLWLPFAPGRYGTFQWVGSGFFIDKAGFVLTNEHVVRDARRIIVSIADPTHGMSVQADLIGVAPQFDLALLRVPPPGLNASSGLGDAEPQFAAAKIGDSDDVMVGEWAIAIGSPFGYELGSLDPSVSVGVISAVQRDVPPQESWQAPWPYLKMIQTDAAIHQGNSGGPLVNANGEVIGVNTVSFATVAEGAGSGIHFAIPINTARWVWQELREYGEVRKPWIGWSVAEIAPEVRAQLQLPEEEGILTVTQVVPDSPADRAGIRPGDVLRTIQGLEPYSLARAERILFGTPVGADVEVEVLRVGDGQLHRSVVHVIEDPYSRAEREARGHQPLG